MANIVVGDIQFKSKDQKMSEPIPGKFTELNVEKLREQI